MLVLDGIVVTPHVRAPNLKYNKPPKDDLAARVELVVRNASAEPIAVQDVRFNGQKPEELRSSGQWAWHSFKQPAASPIPPGARAVWRYNARVKQWGLGSQATVEAQTDRGLATFKTSVDAPTHWLSAVTFLGSESSVHPTRIVCHWANQGQGPAQVRRLQLFVPSRTQQWDVYDREAKVRQVSFQPSDGVIAVSERGIVQAQADPLPLTYGLVRLDLAEKGKEHSIWARVRIKRESFDVSGGWVGAGSEVGHSLTYEPFLKTLRRMHVNTAHIQETPGYTDNPALYAKYPLKYFHGFHPRERYDRDEVLPRLHAAEFLGEPQYPNPENLETPQKVFDALAQFSPSRIATTVTLSDESTWNLYAGLSDFPHYDSYRVVAPHVDAWGRYDRWGGKRIIWGSPLEAIGEMSRSLREISRPSPTAYWSQGPADGWKGFDGRRRRSPTPDEIRLQAYHALASRITSLYWFNLSPKSIVGFRDTIDELTRIGREMRMLEEFYLEGDAYSYRRLPVADGRGWDLSSISAPRGALLFALDLDYAVDFKERVFVFPPKRSAEFEFPLPPHLRRDVVVFRIDADGTYDVPFELAVGKVRVHDSLAKVGIYVATSDPKLRQQLEERRRRLVDHENVFGFDPASNDADFEQLQRMIKK
jgi:hypothetical protein